MVARAVPFPLAGVAAVAVVRAVPEATGLMAVPAVWVAALDRNAEAVVAEPMVVSMERAALAAQAVGAGQAVTIRPMLAAEPGE